MDNCECKGFWSEECDRCKYNLSYCPDNPNGVLFVLKEPGGCSENFGKPQKNLEGNNFWNRKCICDCNREQCLNSCESKNRRLASTYRNRYKDLLKAIGFDNPDKELARCCFANFCYGRSAAQIGTEKGYGSLIDHLDTLNNRWNSIKEDFLGKITENGVVHIFLIDDAFHRLIEGKREGLQYKSLKEESDWHEPYKMNEFNFEGINCRIYAMRHPIRCPGMVKLSS